MSDKKVNSKMLKDLIKEVLEEQRLDEKAYNIKGWKDIDGKIIPDLDDSSLSRVSGPGKVVKKGTKKTDYLSVASGGKSPALEPDDLSSPKATSILNPGVEKDPTKYGTVDGGGGDGEGATAAELAAAGLTTTTKAGKEVGVGKVRSWAQAVIDAAGAGNAGLAARLFQSFETFMYKNKGKSFPKSGDYQKAKKELANPPASATPADLQKTYKSLIDLLNKGIAVSDRDFTQPFGRMSVGSEIESKKGALAGAKQLRVKADSSMVEVFNSVMPNGSIEDKLNRLSQIGKDIEKDEDLGHLTDQQALEYANAMTVYGYIANAAKSFGSQAGGYEFEKILSLLLQGAQVGGSNGAADVLSISKDGKVFYSAKLLSDINSLEQALGGEEGVNEVLKKGPIIYIAGVKAAGTGSKGAPKGEATEYAEIYWYIFKINSINDVQWLNSNGDWDATKVSMKNSTTHLKVGPGNFKKYFAMMPVLDSATKDKSDRAVAKRMVKFVDNFANNDMLKSIKDAALKLQNMERNTMEYRGVAAKGATAKGVSGLSPAAYVKQVATDFTSIKTDFKEIFKKPVSGASQTDLDKFNESKKIITSDFLKKLIQETLKK